MTFSVADFAPLTLDLALLAGLVLVLVVDLDRAAGAGRVAGLLSAAILAAIFVASFFVDTSGSAFGGAYQGGAWALFFKRVFLFSGAVAALGSVEHVEARHPRRQGEYYVLLLASLLGMTLLPGVRDLILLMVSFELMGIPLFVLAAWAKTDERHGAARYAPEGALKLYLVGVVSTATTLFGLSLVFGLSGTTNILRLGAASSSPLLTAGLLLMVAGMGFKIGAVPFHSWVPDTYQAAGTPFVAFLSVAPKIAGFAALAVVLAIGFGSEPAAWRPTLIALSVASMLLGNLVALAQTNVKRLLAYSGIGQIGYMLMAFAAVGPGGMRTLLFYTAAYATTNLGAFLVVEAVSADGGDDSIASFAGLSRRSPALALAMLLFLLSLAGIPFVVGFWAKLYVFVAAWEAGLEWLVVLGAVLAVVGLFYYMQIARAMYMVPPSVPARVRTGRALRAALIVSIAGVVGAGLAPAPLFDDAARAAESLAPAPATETVARVP
ncbi:MAG: NADH-quinone oxidoreductase subunit N [Sorangiineae bacterium]|nr:NADH-quinone oxidoreductase subunit N [Polyangiaceae bacterium]MEB2321561.1 NADH-quinone oxidoreductase subunit N [Sorangiineae bacterium]